MCVTTYILKINQLSKPGMSTKNSSAPEQKILQANLEEDNTNLCRALNWVNPCKLAQSKPNSIPEHSLSYSPPVLENTLRVYPAEVAPRTLILTKWREDFSSRISMLMSKQH